MQYSQTLWLLFFFIYCFSGWIWESLYVSTLKREWVNRGFLHGPMLPIYGFGAIIILRLTLPFSDSFLHIFVLGMLGATLLEYVTGAAMERLFHMRYWDYSGQPFNLNGHISLLTSLGWGVFSILLVKVLHPPVEALLLIAPPYATEPASLILMIFFVADATKSVQAALDTKELLGKLTEFNESFGSLETRLDSLASSISQGSEELQEHLTRIEADLQENVTHFQQQRDLRKESRKDLLLGRLQEYRDKKSRFLALLSEKADGIIHEVHLELQSPISEKKQEQLSGLLTELYEFKDGLKKIELFLATRKDKEYKIAASLIRRNPTSVSRRFKESFKEIKSLNEARSKHRKDEAAE